MLGCLTLDGNFANPASRSHVFGWRAEEAVEQARRQLADLIGADPREIVWTSGATESDNLAIKGVVRAVESGRARHIVTSAIEHKAVLDSCAFLESEGVAVTYLAPGRGGLIDPDDVAQAINDDTVLVSVMHVNNELGTINDIAAIGERCRQRGVCFHVDAAQSVAKVPLDLATLPVDLLSISAHKMYGPKGVGALYVRRRPSVALQAQIHGGGHERGMRSGTLPVHQIVGLGEAARVASQELSAERARLGILRERLWQGLQALPSICLHGHPQQCVAGILNVGFVGVEGESLLIALKDLALSTGSACTSASLEPSYVLQAIGVDDALAHASLRISLGRYTSEGDIDVAVEQIVDAVSSLRAVSPQWQSYLSG
jgi:cysteine desulfurase